MDNAVILFEKGKIAPVIICSNLKDLVNQQQYIFDKFWNRGIPAYLKIREIESNRSAMINLHYETKVLENQEKISEKIKDLIETSDELLVCSDYFSLRLQALGYCDCVPFSYGNPAFQNYRRFCHIYYRVVP